MGPKPQQLFCGCQVSQYNVVDGQPCLPYSDPNHGGLWAPAEEGSASGRAEGEPLAHSRALHVCDFFFFPEFTKNIFTLLQYFWVVLF